MELSASSKMKSLNLQGGCLLPFCFELGVGGACCLQQGAYYLYLESTLLDIMRLPNSKSEA